MALITLASQAKPRGLRVAQKARSSIKETCWFGSLVELVVGAITGWSEALGVDDALALAEASLVVALEQPVSVNADAIASAASEVLAEKRMRLA